MTRENAKQNLIAFGIAEPSDEQITNYLNQVNAESKRERDRADKYKDDALKVSELQKQLDDLNAQNMTDLEKESARANSAEELVNQLRGQLTASKIQSIFAGSGFTGDEYAGVINAFATMKEEDAISGATNFVNGLTTNRDNALKAAKASWEKELLDKTPNPGGSAGGQGGEDKPADVLNAETINFGGLAKNAQSARDYYK